MSKNKIPTEAEILEKSNEYDTIIDELRKEKKGSKTSKFLSMIEDKLKKNIEDGLSYRTISKAIFKTYSFRISEQTIRAYAHNVLGVPKKKRKSKSDTTTNATENRADTTPQKMENSDGIKTEKKGF